MVNYLTLGLLGSNTSLLVEGFSLDVITIQLYFYLNKFSVNSLVAFNYLKLISNKTLNIKVVTKYSSLNILQQNKLVKYRINKYSKLNKINVN